MIFNNFVRYQELNNKLLQTWEKVSDFILWREFNEFGVVELEQNQKRCAILTLKVNGLNE